MQQNCSDCRAPEPREDMTLVSRRRSRIITQPDGSETVGTTASQNERVCSDCLKSGENIVDSRSVRWMSDSELESISTYRYPPEQ